MPILRCLLILALGLGLAACSTEGIPDGIECPVTVPSQPGLTPPSPYPSMPSIEGTVWIGSPELWTILAIDGSYQHRKSVWWSERFTDPGLEPEPAISVVWHRLDVSVNDISNGGIGTNASTAEDGLFMIAGTDPEEDGCWEVSATYKGAKLSYVYEKVSTGDG